MAFIEWSEDLSVRIPSVDRQHKVLIGLINKLEQAAADGKSAGVLEMVLNGLVHYAQAHFLYEEMLLERTGWSSFDNHKVAHHKLFDHVNTYATRFKSGDREIAGELLEFLMRWLTQHILKEDMRYTSHLLEHGIK